MLDNGPMTALISTLGGIAIAYITAKSKTALDNRAREKHPKNRMEEMFDGYERLIKQRDVEDQRKTLVIERLEKYIEDLEAQLNATKALLVATREELAVSRTENSQLRNTLEYLKREYQINKDAPL